MLSHSLSRSSAWSYPAEVWSYLAVGCNTPSARVKRQWIVLVLFAMVQGPPLDPRPRFVSYSILTILSELASSSWGLHQKGAVSLIEEVLPLPFADASVMRLSSSFAGLGPTANGSALSWGKGRRYRAPPSKRGALCVPLGLPSFFVCLCLCVGSALAALAFGLVCACVFAVALRPLPPFLGPFGSGVGPVVWAPFSSRDLALSRKLIFCPRSFRSRFGSVKGTLDQDLATVGSSLFSRRGHVDRLRRLL